MNIKATQGLMREAMFIKKNAEKWQTYQQTLPADPDDAAERFITLMDDLAYAKTFYPRSKATKWINGLAAGTYQDIYRNKKEKYSRLYTFFTHELPLIIRRHHRVFLFTALIFILFVAIGAFSSMRNPDFLRGVLGDSYVNQTEDNIAAKDPFGIYKGGNSFNMFTRIAFNNIFVALRTVLGGLTLGIFTMMDMWNTGVMLGSFQQKFFAADLGMQSILVIWIHGTIEIASIIIAGAAGFIIANGVLFPGTYKRLESFKQHAKDAAKIFICLVPFFLTAAFFEGYITRLMSRTIANEAHGLPVWAGVLILFASLSLMVWYFIIRPIALSKKGYQLKKHGIISRTLVPDE